MAGSLTTIEEKKRASYLQKHGGGVYREGHFKMDGRFVQVTAQTYPGVKWFIEDVVTLTPHETANRRELTEEDWRSLEPWL